MKIKVVIGGMLASPDVVAVTPRPEHDESDIGFSDISVGHWDVHVWLICLIHSDT